MRPNAAMLSEIPLFALLGDAERATLVELMETVRYRKGETIFTCGDPGNSLIIVRSGRVRILLEDDRGQRIVLGEGGPGELFGEVSLLDGGPRTASIIALTDVEALSLDRDDLLELVTLRPTAALSLMTVMGQRQRSTSGLLRAHGSRNVNDEEEVRLTASRRAAAWAASILGSWTFLLATASAIVAASCAPVWGASRPPAEALVPALLGLIFVQTSVLLIAWNRQTAKDRLKANLEYQFNLKTELGFARIEESLERVSEQVRSLVSGSQADEALGRSHRVPPD
ncbi:MAG: cyclic nucleotide-binding domain-containing protein [Planctomycetia bacterium]|nr:cyclic nucleotide-binding domain-containing protein [Planctomycetia bacterium]